MLEAMFLSVHLDPAKVCPIIAGRMAPHGLAVIYKSFINPIRNECNVNSADTLGMDLINM
jgi:hypothetical protein